MECKAIDVNFESRTSDGGHISDTIKCLLELKIKVLPGEYDPVYQLHLYL